MLYLNTILYSKYSRRQKSNFSIIAPFSPLPPLFCLPYVTRGKMEKMLLPQVLRDATFAVLLLILLLLHTKTIQIGNPIFVNVSMPFEKNKFASSKEEEVVYLSLISTVNTFTTT